MQVITGQIAKAYPKSNERIGANVMALVDAMAANVRPGLLLLLGVVLLVLLIACANVASLLLARGAARQRELAVRAALGAGRARIARQLLTESLLLAAAGGGFGLAIGSWTARGLAAMLTSSFPSPRINATHTDAWVLAFGVALSLTTGLIFGLVPALSSASPDLTDAMRDTSRGSTGARAPRLRSGLVIVEAALALILLAGAGILLKTFATLRATQPGFQADHLLAVDLWLPQPRFALQPDRQRFYDDVLNRLRETPGVRSAAFVADLPLNGGSDGLGFHIAGRPDPKPGVPFTAGFNVASADYFRTMGIALKAGRDFSDTDRGGTPGVMSSADGGETVLAGPIAIGQRSRAARDQRAGRRPRKASTAKPCPRLTVVSVTGDVRHQGRGCAASRDLRQRAAVGAGVAMERARHPHRCGSGVAFRHRESARARGEPERADRADQHHGRHSLAIGRRSTRLRDIARRLRRAGVGVGRRRALRSGVLQCVAAHA